jgi:ubiquinone/menaquinone biosynthesis C-methylase UbiE
LEPNVSSSENWSDKLSVASPKAKPIGYFSCDRPELVPLIPAEATRILEVGCGEGRFANTLRAARPASRLEIVGVEVNEAAGQVARSVLDHVIVGNVEQLEVGYDNYFDCVVFADVLEHLVDPWKVLCRARSFLKDGGRVVASIPNVQHWAVLADLLRGRWDYAEYGIMDNTHLRFFTRTSIRDLFESTGFGAVEIRPLLGATARAQIVRLATAGLAIPFLARQYLVVAQKRS